MASTFAQALAHRASSDPDRELLRVVGMPGWTALDLWRRAASWATELADTVRCGDVVMSAADTGPDAVALTAALSALGAVELPLAPDLPLPWADRLHEVTRPRLLAVTHARARSQPSLAAIAADHDLTLITVDTELAPDRTGRAPRDLAPTAPALIMSTSGTTGRAKAALLPVGAAVRQAQRVADAMAYSSDDVLLSCFGWHHINARHAAFLPALISGARLVVTPRFSASQFWTLAHDEGVTAFNFMGAMMAMLLAQPPSASEREHHVRAAYGGPAPAELVGACQERFDVTLHQAYACTELADVAVTRAGEIRPGAAGRIVPDYDVRVVDETGVPLPAGHTGELLVRPRAAGLTFLRYVGDPEASVAAWSDGWFRTRDRVRLEDDWLYVEGRLGDGIRRRGINIEPSRIEQTAMSHPKVAQAAAIAVPSQLTEDEILLLVVPREGHELTAPEIWRHCREHLARHEVPLHVSLEEALPHNENLKIDRAALRVRGLPRTAWTFPDHHAPLTPRKAV